MLDLSGCKIQKPKKPRKIAVDFDGTLCKDKYPDIGEPNTKLIASLIQNRKEGDLVYLFTSRVGAELQAAISFCKQAGLEFDGICGGKVSANIYIDDKAIKPIW